MQDPRAQRTGGVVAPGDGVRRPAHEQVPDGRTQRVHVRGDRAVGPAVEHLGRRPRVGDPDLVVAGDLLQPAGDPEVGERRLVVARDQHVAGLDVAVHGAGPVRRLDRAGELDAGADRVGHRQRAGPDPHPQVRRGAEAHHQERPVVRGHAGGQHRHDVGVVAEPGHRVGLGGEQRALPVVERDVLADHLDRHPLLRPLLLVAVDVGEPAAAEVLDEGVAGDDGCAHAVLIRRPRR